MAAPAYYRKARENAARMVAAHRPGSGLGLLSSVIGVDQTVLHSHSQYSSAREEVVNASPPDPGPVKQTKTVRQAGGSLAHAEAVVNWTASHCAAVELSAGEAATAGSGLSGG